MIVDNDTASCFPVIEPIDQNCREMVQERTEQYAAEAGDPDYKLGWRRWFGEVLTDWQPSCDGADSTTAAQPRGPKGTAAPTTETEHAIRPPEEWTAADLRDPYAST